MYYKKLKYFILYSKIKITNPYGLVETCFFVEMNWLTEDRSKINPMEVIIFSSPAPVGHLDHPLRCAPLLWKPLVCLHPVLIPPPTLQESPCPALTFLYLPNLSRTLCSRQPGLFPPLALCLFSVLMCALPPAPFACMFCSFFISQGPPPSYSSPE